MAVIQKPRETAISKDHLKDIENWLQLWYEGNITEQYMQYKNMQERMHYSSSETNSTANSIRPGALKTSFCIKAGCKMDMLKVY